MFSSDHIINVSDANFDTVVVEYSFTAPVVVDFWAEWCGPCKMLGPLLEKITNEAGGAFRLAKVDVDNNQNLAIRFGVHSIPAVKGFRDGKIISEFVGAQPEPRVREFLKAIAPSKYDLLIEKANSLIKQQDWVGAINSFEDVLKVEPQNPKALLGASKCYLATNQSEKAINILESFPASREYQFAEKLLPLANALSAIQIESSNEMLDASYNNSIRLIKRGNFQASIDGLLDILRDNKEYLNGRPKNILIALFELLGEETDIVRQYRQELASVLF